MKATKIKNIAVIAAVFLFLCAMPLWSVLLPDAENSRSERRQLAQLEGYAEKKAGREEYGLQEYFSYLEDYLLDQYPARDGFRRVSALWRTGALGQRDNGGYYRVGDGLYRLDGGLSEAAVSDAVGRINAVYEQYFAGTGARCYYAVIPDKSFYAAGENGYPCLEHEGLSAAVDGQIAAGIEKIELTDALDIGDFYLTDPHWSQPEILPCADALLGAMGRGAASDRDFERHELYPFYGTYYGQAALGGKADTLVYLSDAVTDRAAVLNFETGETVGIYDEEDFGNVDPYDVFLQGAAALLRIDNPLQDNGRQLVLLRDSFGSPMAPLLLGEYSQVLVVDIRYVSPALLGKVAQFEEDCDVLFLYSGPVLNSLGAFMR